MKKTRAQGAGQDGDFGAEIEKTHNRPPATRQYNQFGMPHSELIGDDTGAAAGVPKTTPSPTRSIADITIGIRHRRDLGDVESLARSIEDIGLLHPIIVDEDGRLLAGARRLAACKHLGWTEIPVKVVRCA
jgi:hypothetical protein